MYSDVTVPTFVERTRKVRTISFCFLKNVLIKFLYGIKLIHYLFLLGLKS
jgi:hypothetical protein